MIGFFIGCIVGVVVALFIEGACSKNHDNDIYMEGYCAGIKSARGEKDEQ